MRKRSTHRVFQQLGDGLTGGRADILGRSSAALPAHHQARHFAQPQAIRMGHARQAYVHVIMGRYGLVFWEKMVTIGAAADQQAGAFGVATGY